jgi:O-antigen ligase
VGAEPYQAHASANVRKTLDTAGQAEDARTVLSRCFVIIVYYFLVWILPLWAHPFWGQKIGPLTVFEYIGVVCLIYAFACAVCLHKFPFPPLLDTWETRLFVLLYFIALYSATTKGAGLALSDSALILYTSSLSLIFITLSVIDNLRRLRWLVLALVGSYGFASLYVIREWQRNHLIYRGFRPGWVVGDANYFSAAAIFAIALGFCFMQGRRPRWEKAYCSGCLLLTILAVTFCASRGGFLGLAAAALWLVWHTDRRVRNLVLISVVVIPLSLAVPVSPLHRFLDPSADHGSAQFHLEAWRAGLRMIEAHPIAGVGLGNFKPLMPLYGESGLKVDPIGQWQQSPDIDSVAHNMFIEVAAELGLPALLVFLGIFWFTYRTLGKLRRSSSTHPLIRETASALQAGLVGFAVAGSFISAEYQKTSWMGFALMFCLLPLARSQKLARRELRLGSRKRLFGQADQEFRLHPEF